MLRFFKLFSISFLLLISHISLAVEKTIDGSTGTDTLDIDYTGISNLGDFTLT